MHVEGYLKLDTWDDKATGQKRSTLKVEAETVQFLGGREDSGHGGPAATGHSHDEEAPAPARRSSSPANGANGPSRGGYTNGPASPSRRPAPEPEADDDIPF